MSPDEQDQAEVLDEDRLEGSFPPDHPEGLGEYGLTAREQEVDEPIEERVRREVPDRNEPPADEVAALVDPAAVGGPDEEARLVAEEHDRDTTGPLEEGDPAAGDPTTRDVATERSPGVPAEEAAMHLSEDPER